MKTLKIKRPRNVSTGAFAVVTVLFILSLTYNIFQQKSIYEYVLRPQHSTVIGTYCSGAQESSESQYLVFMQDGSYWRYQQFCVLEQGTYTEAEENIFDLESSDETARSLVFYTVDQVSLIDSEGRITVFPKLDDTPMLINARPPERL